MTCWSVCVRVERHDARELNDIEAAMWLRGLIQGGDFVEEGHARSWPM